MTINHIGFTVSDLDAAIVFFTRHFGFSLRDRQLQDNDYTRATVGVPDAVIDNAMLTSADASGTELQLLQYRRPAETGTFPAVQQPGSCHLALTVDDIEALYHKCRGEGVTFLSPPNTINSGRNNGGSIAYAVGPDNLRIELFQPAPQPATQSA